MCGTQLLLFTHSKLRDKKKKQKCKLRDMLAGNFKNLPFEFPYYDKHQTIIVQQLVNLSAVSHNPQ